MQYKLLYNNQRRPNGSFKKIDEELIMYIKNASKKGYFPSKRELQGKFHLRTNTSIYSLYKSAGLKYKLAPNQEIKSTKAQLLLDLALQNLHIFGFELIIQRRPCDRGVDILATKNGERIGIELKAYNKYEKLKSRDIEQAERFIKKEDLCKVIIITTTNCKDTSLRKSDKVDVIDYDHLKKLVKHLENNKAIEYIRNHSVNMENLYRELKRQKILNYIRDRYQKENIKPGNIDICRDLHLDIYTYFNSIFDAYKFLKIPPPLWNMGARRAKNPDLESVTLWKNAFKEYISKELSKGKNPPSGVKIGKHFGISHVWNITKMSDLYKELGLEPYHQRKHRFTSHAVA